MGRLLILGFLCFCVCGICIVSQRYLKKSVPYFMCCNGIVSVWPLDYVFDSAFCFCSQPRRAVHPYTNEAGQCKVLVTNAGKWDDWPRLNFPAVPDKDRIQYFWTYESLYRTLKMPLPGFDKAAIDAKFGGFKHLMQDSTFKDDDWGAHISRMFRIEGEYTWRPCRGKVVWPPRGRLYFCARITSEGRASLPGS